MSQRKMMNAMGAKSSKQKVFIEDDYKDEENAEAKKDIKVTTNSAQPSDSLQWTSQDLDGDAVAYDTGIHLNPSSVC